MVIQFVPLTLFPRCTQHVEPSEIFPGCPLAGPPPHTSSPNVGSQQPGAGQQFPLCMLHQMEKARQANQSQGPSRGGFSQTAGVGEWFEGSTTQWGGKVASLRGGPHGSAYLTTYLSTTSPNNLFFHLPVAIYKPPLGKISTAAC